MKVHECKRCPHMQERKFSIYHVPNNYHPVGFAHVYAYCQKHERRCSEVKAKDCKEMKWGRAQDANGVD